MRRLLLVALVLLVAVPAAHAAQPQFSMSEIETELMCPTCQTRLDLSHSPAADRIRAYVEAKREAGWTKQQVKDALVADFGPSVLAAPPARGRCGQHRRAEVGDERVLHLLLRPPGLALRLHVGADAVRGRAVREVEARLARRAHQLRLDLRHGELRLRRVRGRHRDEQDERDEQQAAHQPAAFATASRRPLAVTAPGNHATARPCASSTNVSGNALTP